MNAVRNRNLAVLALFAAAAGIAGCGGGGGGGGSSNPPPSQLGMTVEPASVLLGQSAELSWSGGTGSSCQASGGWSGARQPSGMLTVTPSATGVITYTLTCSGGSYTSDVSESVTLQVTAATLAQLQANVFTPRCAGCHDGSVAPGGTLPGSMDLRAGSSFASIVNVASLEQPALLRIEPGDPDASYLIRKVQGTAGISGERMPLGAPPLDATAIAQLRSWVAAGAANN